MASSEEEQEMINEVRGLLGNLPAEMPSFLSDATIRRFLRARNWSTEQAAKSLKETVKWRREYKPEAIRWEDIAEWVHEARRVYIADYLDKNGRSVIVGKPSMKTKASAKEQIKQLVYNLETLATNSADEQDDYVVWLNDFRGWALSSTPLSLARESLRIIQNYYPGMIAVAIPSNPPRIFESFWKIAKHFIEPNMKEKVKFVYTNDPESQKIVADMFDLDKLESAFGGRNTVDFDINMYAKRMRRNDRMRGASTDANDNTPVLPHHD